MIHPVNLYQSTRSLWEDSHDHEAVLRHLRENGSNQLDSIKVIRELESCSLGQAKKIVCDSETWRDNLDVVADTHDQILNKFNEL